MTIERRIAAVEHGLRPALRIDGREPERFALAERMERYRVPGAAVAVVDDGEIEWSRGYGTRGPDGEPVTADTLFQAASISKAVAAVGTLALVEHGLFGLDDDVNDHLTSWQLPPSEHTRDRPVTPRHLLSHTAGLTAPGFPGFETDDPLPSVPEILAGAPGAMTEPVESFEAPGRVSQYSGGGTTVLQQMVADVTGRDYAELMHELVLDPLGMHDSAFEQPLSEARRGAAALGHDASGAVMRGGMHVFPQLAAAGLWSSANDLARFVIGVQRILAGSTAGPLAPETARLMVTSVEPGPFGLGPETAPGRFFHNGTNVGYCCQFDALFDEPAGVVVMTNGVGGNTLLGEIRRGVAAEYGWPGFDGPSISLHDVPAETLARYAGRYLGPFDRPLKLELIDGVLSSPSAYGRRRLYPLTATTFVDEETGAHLEFESDGAEVSRIAVVVDGTAIMAYRPAQN